MLAFRPIEPQRFGQGFQDLDGRLHVTPLFQPCVPRGPDAGEERNFFASQSRCAAAEPIGLSDRGGCEALAAGTQEIPKFFPARVNVNELIIRHRISIAVLIPG